MQIEYIDHENNPNNSEHEDGLPGGGPEDPNGPDDPNDPEDPNGPDGPDSEPDNEPEDNLNCLFLHALHDLSDSLQNLCQPQAVKPEKIKVREPDTFNGTNPRKLRDFLVSCNLHFRDHSDVFASDEKRILFIYHTSKDQPLAGSNPALTTQPILHTGCGIIKRFSASLKTISVLTTLSEMPKISFRTRHEENRENHEV